jgi:hypothetical protein
MGEELSRLMFLSLRIPHLLLCWEKRNLRLELTDRTFSEYSSIDVWT